MATSPVDIQDAEQTESEEKDTTANNSVLDITGEAGTAKADSQSERSPEKVGTGVTPDVPGSDSGLNQDSKEERATWIGRLDFLLSCIGFAVGLGNIWRFPYLCYKSGGGAFLVPYVAFMILCGIPLFFMEITCGQFASLSPITVWRISPLFKGVGYGMVIISGIVCVYYNVIIAWTFYYLFMSMRSVVPWDNCNNDWNDERCVENKFADDIGTAVNSSQLMTATEQFWELNVLEITDGIEDMGTIRWPLFGCLALAWVVVFLCLCKGVKSSGRVVYVTATFPYLVLIILLVRGATLHGALEGIKFYLIPDWDKLLEFKVWGDAAIQIFYSVGMAWGGLITMASYNKFHNNVYRDAIVVPLINCGTSVFAGLVIFSVIGFMAHETGAEVEDVVTQGPGLTFVVYPEAVAKLPISPLWAMLFFLMLFTIGLDSQFGMFETMTSAFIDEFPHVLKDQKIVFTAFMCFVEFVFGIPCVYQGGMYVLQIMDWYCATFSLMLLSLVESVVISWLYGVNRFYKDIELMIGFKPCAYWKIMWCFITPATILFIWICSVSQLAPVSYGTYQYPRWAIIFGWMLGLCSLLPLPIVMILSIAKEKGTLWQRVRKLARPADNWGPALPENREAYLVSMEP
ncbi:sodium-dependent proline transporter-like [Babylonia areolata]|uniref:sodium-dependent proline transporter-like n=1 Tax=Babylonia areolata TaxID=304850 RepID=UPI003FCFE6A5